MKKILRKIRNKKGASTIEFAISLLLFVTLLVAGYEFFMMGHKYLTVNSFANNLARTIAVQGGVSTTTPKGFQGINTSNNNYKNSTYINNSINHLAESIGQKREDISVSVVYKNKDNITVTKTLNASSEIEIPYNNKFEVIVKYKFRTIVLHEQVKMYDSLEITKRKSDISYFEHEYDNYDED